MAFNFAGPLCAALGALVCFSAARADDLTISGSPPTAADVGALYDFRPQAVAVGPLSVHFEIQNAPPWAQFQSWNGELSGTPGPRDVGTYPDVRISITNGQESSELGAFTILVRGADGSAETSILWVPPTENEDGSPLTDLAGYFIYEGPSAASLARIATAGPAAEGLDLSGLPPGPHYFAVTSVNSSAVESEMSVVVSDQ